MTAREVLNGAAKRLLDKGWIQGCYALTAEARDFEGKKLPSGMPCGAAGDLIDTPVAQTDVIGALRQVGKRHPKAVDEAKAALRREVGAENLADWNDDEARTVEQVVAALKAAAKRA